MRNVVRPPIPNSLATNAQQWQSELDEELAKGDQGDSKRVTSLQGRYNQADVRKSLSRMYSNYCCYCEANVAVVKAGQIEHLKPKAKDCFPEHTYDWGNLHLVCGACNRKKSNQWDNENPILDPVADDPISDHLEYRTFKLNPITCRGKTTIDHPGLDRPDLESARIDIYLAVNEVIEAIQQNPGPRSTFARKKLEDMASGQYGSLVMHVVTVAHGFDQENIA